MPGTSFPTHKYHRHRWLSWPPVTIQLQDVGVWAPRPPTCEALFLLQLTGLQWPPLTRPPTPGERKELTFCFPAFHLKVLSKNPMRAESQWECPAFPPMRASLGHVCLCPSCGCLVQQGGRVSSDTRAAHTPPHFQECVSPVQYNTNTSLTGLF